MTQQTSPDGDELTCHVKIEYPALEILQHYRTTWARGKNFVAGFTPAAYPGGKVTLDDNVRADMAELRITRIFEYM
jgi:hypothetical protein